MIKNALAICLALSPPCLAGTNFEYAGLSLKTDLRSSALKGKYPASNIQEHIIYVSKTDSHNYIHQIRWQTSDGKDEISISFEKPRDELRGGEVGYPKCDEITKRLVRSYKAPIEKDPWNEEAMVHHEKIWTSQTEELMLDCFNMNDEGELLADLLRIRSK